jgi:hypothetical protein
MIPQSKIRAPKLKNFQTSPTEEKAKTAKMAATVALHGDKRKRQKAAKQRRQTMAKPMARPWCRKGGLAENSVLHGRPVEQTETHPKPTSN